MVAVLGLEMRNQGRKKIKEGKAVLTRLPLVVKLINVFPAGTIFSIPKQLVGTGVYRGLKQSCPEYDELAKAFVSNTSNSSSLEANLAANANIFHSDGNFGLAKQVGRPLSFIFF